MGRALTARAGARRTLAAVPSDTILSVCVRVYVFLGRHNSQWGRALHLNKNRCPEVRSPIVHVVAGATPAAIMMVHALHHHSSPLIIGVVMQWVCNVPYC